MRGQAAVVGIGQTEFSKDSQRSELQLAAEATLMALDDAGLTTDDVDGMVTFTLDPTEEVDLARTLGIDEVTWSSRIPSGGGGSGGTLLEAAAAIVSGAAEVVVCYRALNARSGRRFGRARNPDERPVPGTGWTFTNWMVPFGVLSPAATLSMGIRPWMERHGITNEDFGHYIVGIRDFDATNPSAWYYEKPVTLEDHQASRWIIEPVVRLLDCCQESDGGIAIVVTSAERARDLRQPGVAVLGATQGLRSDRADPSTVATRLWASSGVAPGDIDVALLYDAFSPQVFMQLEQFGFCGPGESKDLVRSGVIGRGGRLPVNTNGSLIGEAYIHGMNLITEAVRQVRGTAVNQVEGAELALMSSSSCAHVLGPL